jgi:hypothetical protein
MSRGPSLRSQNGQIAIFLVLIFQVLFVFFAMTVNVGLVVYDKINLQNATDMAAYYSASKQAELLNQIAHVNYQVRQAYKLLTFRLRVIGSLSVGIGPNSKLEPHPIFVGPAITAENSKFFYTEPGGITGKPRPPGACVGSTIWTEYAKIEKKNSVSLCRDLLGFKAVPPVAGGGGDITGLIGKLNSFIAVITGEMESQCKRVGVLNWQFAGGILHAYKLEALRRAEMIDKLAANMSKSGNEITDFRGQLVYNGALNTLKKNLTDAQASTLKMTLVNSLSPDVKGPCSDPTFWLPKVMIYPVVTYVQMLWEDDTCKNTIVTSATSATIPPASYLVGMGGNNELLKATWSDGGSVPMGVEKNPWCMPYMSVTATTSPRKIFAPFGTPVQLKAEAYAKPFGGRIGPWYYTKWPSGDNKSNGVDKVDPLLPTRDMAGTPGPGSDRNNDIVNYSKYPGDKLGMNSRYALGAMNDFWETKMMKGVPVTGVLPAVLSLQHYNHIGDPDEFLNSPDSLVRTNTSDVSAANVRTMEEASVVPDFFDILYYSIEAQYFDNYFNASDPNFRSFLTEYWLDIGSQNRGAYSVFQQIQTSNLLFGASTVPFYLINSPDQTLTGWTQQKANSYAFPDYFGRCMPGGRKDADSALTPAPGGCPHGGRSGYSVKIVSKDYLNSVNADLGGPDNTGPILNPPSN